MVNVLRMRICSQTVLRLYILFRFSAIIKARNILEEEEKLMGGFKDREERCKMFFLDIHWLSHP